MRKLKILMVASAAAMLSSCDLSQIPGLDGKLSLEDSKAVGAACRHSGRALEDCFVMNPNTHQSGVFEGWRDMNDYMLANEIDVVKPEIQNSAFKPEKVSGARTAPMAGGPAQPDSDPASAGADAVPLAQGRQRWSPKGTAESSTTPAVDPAGVAAVEPVPQQEPAAAEAPLAEEPPARPWERKKDPKKHT